MQAAAQERSARPCCSHCWWLLPPAPNTAGLHSCSTALHGDGSGCSPAMAEPPPPHSLPSSLWTHSIFLSGFRSSHPHRWLLAPLLVLCFLLYIFFPWDGSPALHAAAVPTGWVGTAMLWERGLRSSELCAPGEGLHTDCALCRTDNPTGSESVQKKIRSIDYFI